MKKIVFLLLALQSLSVFSQFSDDFNDGLFTGQGRSVNWTGSAADFIVNESHQLQLNANGSNSPSQLKTASSALKNTVWNFFVKLDFNPTTSNYAKVYLASNEPDLNGDLDGFFIRIGYTDKNICLMYSQKGKNNQTLIKGTVQRLNLSSVSVKIKATLDGQGNFNLYSQTDGESDFSLEGSCSISNFPETQWFGVVCVYTSTRNKHFAFDDFVVEDWGESGDDDGESPEPNDIIINELLSNPPTGGNEYVEIYNRSNKILDLRSVSITSRKPSDGSFNKLYPLTSEPLFLQAGGYLVITKSRDLVCEFFNCRPESSFVELPIMPSIANVSGCVVIINNKTNEIVDEFAYNENMHTPGISNKKGIALERIDFGKPTGDASNWASASAASGRGTPGYENSQHALGTGLGNKIQIEYPSIGIEQYQIKYHTDKPGYKCRIYVYDSAGRMIDCLLNNELLGSEGVIYWNGKGKSKQKLSAGIYIIYVELYDQTGKIEKIKLPFVVKR